jgi:DNA (cytosine-5)-methyltransferase 1
VRLATLCSGIGAPEEAARRVGGITPIWCAEIEPQPAAVLHARHPGVENLGDIMAPDFVERALAIGRPDVLVAGTPCQSFSVAGKRAGLSDERGNLTLRFVEIVDGLDDGNLVVLWENVPGIFSSKDNAFGCLLAGLAGESVPIKPTGGRWTDAGLVVGPRRAAAWRVMDAQYQRLAQRRRRVFVVSGPVDWCYPEQILFEFEGVRRDSPPSSKEGQRIAAPPTCGTDSGGAGEYAGRQREDDVNLVPALTASGRGVERTGESRGQDPVVAVSLVGEGHDASEDGTGRGVPLTVSNRGRDGGASLELGGDISTALRTGEGGSGNPMVLASGVTIHGTDKTRKVASMTDIAGALRTKPPGSHENSSTTVVLTDAVRRLMPIEAERLQGFPDDYTAIPWRGGVMADSARYRMIGNSMAVPCIEWILKRITATLAAGKIHEGREDP